MIKGKGQNPFTKRKTGDCYQWKGNGSCSKGESSSFLHKPASGNREVKWRGSGLKPANDRVRKGNEQTSSSVPEVRAQTDVTSSTSLEASPVTGAKIPCPWGAKCARSSRDFRHPPVCHNYMSESRFIYGNHCLFRHADGEEKPSKRSKKESTQQTVAILKHRKVQGCVSQNSNPKKSIPRKTAKVRVNASAGHTVKFSGRTWYEIRIGEAKGPSRGIIQKGDTHERNPCAPKFEERTPEEPSRQEDCARKASWNLENKYIYIYVYMRKADDKATFYFAVKIEASALVSKNTAERMFVVDSGASMHMLSKKDLSSDELDTLRRSRNTHSEGNGNWGGANKRGSTSVRSRS